MSQHRRKDAFIARQRWSTLAVTALGLLLGQPAAHAAGFGQLRVQSSLGQPLRAEIDISGVTAQDADSVAVKLAAPDAYAKAGLNYLPAVGGLKLEVARRPNGSYVARVRSSQPISEPFVDILVDMTWASGKVTRAYTFLLDPAGAGQSNQSYAPAPVIQAATPDMTPEPTPAPTPAPITAVPVMPASASAPEAPSAPRSRRAAATRRAPVEGREAASGTSYTVQRGDNLYAIAGEAAQGQEAISLDQMLVALYRNNPNAFIGGNMNRLKSGAVLKVPLPGEAQSVAPRNAHREVIAHTQGFDTYRGRLATAAAARPATPGSDREQAGNVTTRVQEQAAPSSGPRDELKLSKPDGKAQQAAAAAAEASVAKDRQLKEAESRLAQLEKNVADMQRLLELKNAEIAKLSLADKADKAPAAKPEAASAPQVVPAGAGKTQTAAAVAGPSAQAAAEPATAPAAAASAAAASAPAAPAPLAAAKPADASAAPVKRPPLVVQATPVPEPSFLDGMLANPMTLPGGGLVIALLGGYAIYRRRQKKSAPAEGFENSILSQESTVMSGTNSLLGTAGGQSVDTSQHSVFGADFRIGANAVEATEVDPLAEADVYIAYGRDVQAEEILREALDQDPERQAIRLKLMEIYNTRQDVEGFRLIAEEMFAQTGGQGGEWAQAAAMGRTLEPGNALYMAVAPDSRPLDAGTLTGDQWRTHDPSANPAAPPQETALADLALPLDAFPAPAPGTPITAPDAVSLEFDGAQAFDDAPVAAGEPRDPADLDVPTRARPLDFDLDSLSLDLNAEPQTDLVDAQTAAESAMPLPEPTMLRDGKLAEPIDLSMIAAEGADTTRGISPSTLSGEVVDGARDMQIKFDLAKAYLEIGDKEGARELLQEVADQSTEPLQTEARNLLREVA